MTLKARRATSSALRADGGMMRDCWGTASPGPVFDRLGSAMRTTRGAPLIVRVVIAAGLIGTSVPLRDLLFGATPALPYLPLFMAVVLAAAFLGRAPALAAAFVGCGILLWQSGWRQESPERITLTEAIAAASFLALAGISAIAVEATHRACDALVRARQWAEEAGREKDLLLTELGHRIKNDLQRVAAVLLTQASQAPDHASASVLRAAAAQVRVLGRLHERLSRRDGAGFVDSRTFFSALVDDLTTSVGGLTGRIAITAEADTHTLPLAVAANLGLVTNELVTNALKHGYPEGGSGEIRIGFLRDGALFMLEVSDDGVGLHATPHKAESGERGGGQGRLLAGALARQLGGQLDIRSDALGGTKAVLAFPATAARG